MYSEENARDLEAAREELAILVEKCATAGEITYSQILRRHLLLVGSDADPNLLSIVSEDLREIAELLAAVGRPELSSEIKLWASVINNIAHDP